jgi:hypothetical protein
MMPVTGFHSVIDRPDSVRRVSPPTTTIASTIRSGVGLATDSAVVRETTALTGMRIAARE